MIGRTIAKEARRAQIIRAFILTKIRARGASRGCRAASVKSLSLDGQAISGETIPLRDDHQEHAVEMKVGRPIKSNVGRSAERTG